MSQPTEFDLVAELTTDNFEGVMERNRNFETIYQPSFQISGLFGNAGRQQDRSHYRVYYLYEYSTSFVLGLAFTRLVFNIVGGMTQMFAMPQHMVHIANVAICSYFFGTLLLNKSQQRAKLLFAVFKYSYLYLFYAKVYPYNNNFVSTVVLYAALFNKAMVYLHNFCLQYEQLIFSTFNGLGEIIALGIGDTIKESVQQDLEDDLREEIFDQARRHKLKKVKDAKRERGLPVEEFDDLSEEEEKSSATQELQ